MKILVLNYEFPPIGGGGGRASADLAREMTRRGHEVRVITSAFPGLARVANIEGYRVIRVPAGRRSRSQASFGSMLAYIIAALLPALSACMRWKADVIHVHFAVPTGAVAFLISSLTGVPYLMTIHLGDVPGGVPEKTARWFRFVYPFTPVIWRSASAVVAVSEYTRRLALEQYDVPVLVVPNGIEVADPQQLALEPPAIRRLVFAGRFQPQKNLIFLLRALDEVGDLPWRCALVGDGPLRSTLEAQIQALDLGDQVEITGWVSGEEVRRRLSESDVLVMPSLSEGLPVVALQALAHGLAIVGNAAGGMIDLVEQDVNGRLCPVGDERCFIHALRWCLEDSDRLLEMRKASLEIAGRFDIRQVAQRYETILERIGDAGCGSPVG